MGAADPARSVHDGKNHLLEMSENQRPHIQHHIEIEEMREEINRSKEEGSLR